MLHNFNLSSIIHENFKCFSLPVLENSGGQKYLLKITKPSIFRNRKWRHQNKKSIIDFYHKVSCVKISRKSIEAFSRNPLHKISKWHWTPLTRHYLVHFRVKNSLRFLLENSYISSWKIPTLLFEKFLYFFVNSLTLLCENVFFFIREQFYSESLW